MVALDLVQDFLVGKVELKGEVVLLWDRTIHLQRGYVKEKVLIPEIGADICIVVYIVLPAPIMLSWNPKWGFFLAISFYILQFSSLQCPLAVFGDCDRGATCILNRNTLKLGCYRTWFTLSAVGNLKVTSNADRDTACEIDRNCGSRKVFIFCAEIVEKVLGLSCLFSTWVQWRHCLWAGRCP